jgi:hypothetical protein
MQVYDLKRRSRHWNPKQPTLFNAICLLKSPCNGFPGVAEIQGLFFRLAGKMTAPWKFQALEMSAPTSIAHCENSWNGHCNCSPCVTVWQQPAQMLRAT